MEEVVSKIKDVPFNVMVKSTSSKLLNVPDPPEAPTARPRERCMIEAVGRVACALAEDKNKTV